MNDQLHNNKPAQGSIHFMLLKLLLFILSFFFLVDLQGQSFNEKIYLAYISGDMKSWEEYLQAEDAGPEIKIINYDLAMAHYGFIGYCLGRDEKSRARPYLDRAEQLTGYLLEENPEDPTYLALKGALYGFRMSYQPQKIMTIGPKALKIVNLAIDKGPECPQARIEAGNKDWFMPAAFGGSKERAISEYERAIGLMERSHDFTRQNWYYLNVQMILAGWYETRNMTFKAREVYRKLLLIEPDFQWAREKLNGI